MAVVDLCRATPSRFGFARPRWIRPPPGSSAKSGHAYPSHTTSAATSMMTVSANKSRSHEFMPQNGRAEGENSSIAGPCVLDH
jgi:hypothetical protein